MNQGKKATNTGQGLEKFVEQSIKRKFPSVRVIQYSKFASLQKLSSPQYLVTGFPYANIYGGKSKTEFVMVLVNENKTMRIECKWQQVSGSVDEKFPYMLENMKLCKEDLVILIVDGGGARPTAVKWLRDQANKTKHVRVMNMAEFTVFMNNYQ
jgi:hypothetical protein